jgi:hypothetical protein
MGVDTQEEPGRVSTAGGRRRAPEDELQRRYIEAVRHRREARLWVIALVSALAALASAVASVVSAFAAWAR